MPNKPHCKFHVGREMVPLLERVPAFVASAEEGYGANRQQRERTILHCDVPGCNVVASWYDAELKTPKLCSVCKKVSLIYSRSICSGCAREYRKRHPH